LIPLKDSDTSAGNDSSLESDGQPQIIVPVKTGLLARLRTYFLTGILITAPIAITVAIAIWFIDFVDSSITPLIPARYNPETYLPFSVPGLGLVVLVIFLTVVGFLTANFIGRQLVRFGERMVDRMPVVRSIYGALKQLFETVLAQSSTSFRQCVLVEWPRRDLWTLAFVTGGAQGEIRRLSEGDLVAIYVPTTPNPTSGYLMYVPKRDLKFLDMSVEDGLKLVLSGGLVVPPDKVSGVAQADPPSLPPEEDDKQSVAD
jgi:uncharacterized membrane protein